MAPPKYLLFDSLGYYSWNALPAQLCLYFVQNLRKSKQGSGGGDTVQNCLSQTFRTKKGDDFAYKNVQGGDALTAYAICPPPMSVSMPQVKCMTTPMSVRMKTPTRHINIEEYAESSSESEEMPYNVTE